MLTKAQVNQVFDAFLAANGHDTKMMRGRSTALPELLNDLLSWGSPKAQPDGFVVSHKAHYGGEGQGDEYWDVYCIEDKSNNSLTYAQFSAWYESHNGCEWDGDDFNIVYPKEVTVVRWSVEP